VAQVLPWGLALAKGRAFSPTWPRSFGAVVVLVGFILGGGVVALMVGGATTPKHAIAYGLAWQSLFGGLLQTPGGGAPPPGSN
jgi:hypothetical protein